MKVISNKFFALFVASVVAVVCCFACCGKSPAEPPQKYNVVFIVSDALRAANLEVYGYPHETAPNLTQIAKRSVLFKNHFANAPYTRLSVSQMFTSMLIPPMLMGHEHTKKPKKETGPDLFMLPGIFKAAGYDTTIISAHPWFSSSARVLRYFGKAHIVRPRKRTRRKYANFRDLTPYINKTIEDHEGGKKPFFLYLHTMDTHGPFNMHPGFSDHKNDPKWPSSYKKYDSEIMYTDHWTKKLLDKLDRHDLLKKTIIVFTSDHGEEFNEMGPEKENRGHGQNLRKAAVHVPLIVHIPALPDFKGVFEGLTDHLDLSPTLVSLAIKGVKLPMAKIQGRDLSGQLLSGKLKPNSKNDIFLQNGPLWSMRRAGDPNVAGILNSKNKTTEIFSSAPDENNYPRPFRMDRYASGPLYEKRIQEIRGSASESYDALPKYKSTQKANQKDPPIDPELTEQLKALGYVE